MNKPHMNNFELLFIFAIYEKLSKHFSYEYFWIAFHLRNTCKVVKSYWYYKHSQIALFVSVWVFSLTLPMLRLFLSKAQRCKYFWKPSKPCHVGTRWKALAEYSQISTHLPGFQSFFSFLHHFVSTKIATSSVRVKLSFSWGITWWEFSCAWCCPSPVMLLWPQLCNATFIFSRVPLSALGLYLCCIASKRNLSKTCAWPRDPIRLTLPMLRLLHLKDKEAKIFENHLNPVMLVLIGKLSLSTLGWVPMCQVAAIFSFFAPN